MIIIPAVDIKDGKCVRLLQGRMDDDTVYSDDPEAMAAKWERLGAERIHVIDLDGAFLKNPQNVESIRKIAGSVQVPIQLGGGIRNEKTVDMYLEMGIKYVIIGTEAIKNPTFVRNICQAYPGQVIVGIDAREGKVAIDGWTQTTQVEAVDLARKFEDCGVAAINFTDIARDGMQTGPNLAATKQLAEAISIPVVASGGVSSIQDIKDLLPLETSGVIGVIVGKALYSGALELKSALELTNSPSVAAE
ncbi:MAG: 1-(5-phosphoribosyl)-5-[(5-phosphoribosylamino)methylideneamino]imidazole-4-carboxamide isomerase [Desulfobacterales bacterium]|nr:1-(5-phosphoribosyl)-5-[(5-phosphoribosylamino)methylideneamino]imidazole-4-carboxamide isomerase [Desulfobacterales bacterium]